MTFDRKIHLLLDKVDQKFEISIKKAPKKITNFLNKLDDAFCTLATDERRHIENINFFNTPDSTQISQAEHIDVSLKIGLATLVFNFIASKIFPPLVPLSLGPMAYAASPILKEGYYSLKNGKVNVSVLDSFIAIGCFVTGNYIMYSFSLTIVSAARKLQNRTEYNSKKELINIFDKNVQTAFILVDDVEVEIPIENIEPQDIVVVSGGQTIAVDGVITKGFALIDQHALTGESQPAEKEVGDSVWAMTVVLSGRICISVRQAGHDVMASHIAHMLLRTTNYKTKVQSSGEKLADRIALPMITASILAYPLAGTVGMLIVAMAPIGYDIRFTASMSLLTHLNLAAREHILIKDGQVLEKFKDIDTIVFDKTGTLTLATPSIGKIYTTESYSEKQILQYAATAEQKQSHPIAKAILEKVQELNLNIPKEDEISYEIGYGIKAHIQNYSIYVGSKKFFDKENIATNNFNSFIEEPELVVFVALNMKCIGAIELLQTVRPGVYKTIEYLKNNHIDVYIVSGDQELPTKKLANRLGVSYFAETLPKDKSKIIEKLQLENRQVCFVGDGINDAIALQRADVSISLEGATNLATDCAQVILMTPELDKICSMFELSKNFNEKLQKLFHLSFVPGVAMVTAYAVWPSFVFAFFASASCCTFNIVKSLTSVSEKTINIHKQISTTSLTDSTDN